MEKKKASYVISIFSGFFFFILTSSVVFAATLSVTPASGTYEVGERAVVRVVVSGETPLNAITGTLSFPTSLFSIESVSKSGSVLNFWIAEPSFSNQSGTVQFEGVALSGFQGGSGTVLTIYLKAIKTGSGNVSFKSGQILANDGQGTDITSGLQGGVYVVEQAQFKPQVEPAKEEKTEIEAPVVEVVKSDLNSPVIVFGVQNGLDAIQGSSKHAKTDVILTFVSSNGSKVFITGVSDASGDFSLIVPQSLKNGPYSVTAIMVLPDGSRSDPSNTLTIEVGGVFYGDISWKTSTYGILSIAFLLLLYIAFLVARRRRGSSSKARALIKKEVVEAQDVLEKSFNIIREDVESYEKEILSEGVSNKKTARNLKKNLDAAEKIIEKEIEDIRSIPIDDSK